MKFKHTTYVKSFEGKKGEMLHTSSSALAGLFTEHLQILREPCQYLSNILSNGYKAILYPNTFHSQIPKRISASYLIREYPETYRSEALVFETDSRPAFWSPVDVMALTNIPNLKSFCSSDNYFSSLMNYASYFMKGSLEEMTSKFPNFDEALRQLNILREKNKLKPIERSKIKAYNECCFFEPIDIWPKALIGDSDEIKSLAEKCKLRCYKDSREYLAPPNIE